MTKNRQTSRARQADGSPNPIDIHVGKRLKLRRQIIGLSQERLAELLGITFQQIQKYEKGITRISVSRLWYISQILNVPIGFFIENLSTDDIRAAQELVPEMPLFTTKEQEVESDCLELLSYLKKIKSPVILNDFKQLIFDVSKL